MQRQLYDFLLQRFSTPELSRFVFFHYRELVAEMPAGAVSHAEYTQALISRLEERGLLDNAFFNRLAEARPRFLDVISAMRKAADAARPVADAPTVIAFLAANPSDTTPLNLDEERLRVEQVLRRSARGRGAQLQPFPGTTIQQLREIVRTYQPAVLHFSGHGGPDGALYLEDADGRTNPLDGEALGAWLETRDPAPRLLVLNACYGARNALPLARAIDVVVGMTHAVSDAAAITFAQDFYIELGAGESVGQAFRSARAAVATSHKGQETLLQLNTRPGVSADRVKLFP